MSRWPSLPRICLSCRTALGDDETCDGGDGHDAVVPGDPLGAERLRRVAWGSPSERRRAVEHARGGSSHNVIVNAMLVGTAGLVAAGSAFLFAGPLIAGVTGAVLVATLSFGRARRWLREGARQRLLPPRGATSWSTPADTGAVSFTGTVIAPAAAERTPPFGGRAAVAFGVWLYADDHLTYRECATLGFDLETDDGTRVRIPPGRIHIEPADRAHAERVPWSIRRYASVRGGSLDAAAMFPLIPLDRYAVALVRRGERIEISARVQSRPDTGAAPGDYRSAHPTLQLATGVPLVRVRHHSRE